MASGQPCYKYNMYHSHMKKRLWVECLTSRPKRVVMYHAHNRHATEMTKIWLKWPKCFTVLRVLPRRVANCSLHNSVKLSRCSWNWTWVGFATSWGSGLNCNRCEYNFVYALKSWLYMMQAHENVEALTFVWSVSNSLPVYPIKSSLPNCCILFMTALRALVHFVIRSLLVHA